WCAGKPGCPVYLQYTSWTDTEIVVDGFGLQYGSPYKVAEDDKVSIFVQNNPGPEFAIWTGKLNPSAPPALDPSGPTPQIEKVTFTDIGQNMHIQIDGAGFGNAPATLPVDNQLDQFSITDTSAAWCAGKPGCEVYLQYTS